MQASDDVLEVLQEGAIETRYLSRCPQLPILQDLRQICPLRRTNLCMNRDAKPGYDRYLLHTTYICFDMS